MLGQGLGFGALDDRRPAVVTVGFGVLDQLGAHQFFQLGFAAQQGLQLGLFLEQLILLGTQLHLFQSRQLTQTGVEDVVGLNLAQGEAFDQFGPWLFLGTDDVDHFIQVEVGNQQTVQQVQATLDLVEAELQATTHGLHPELQPLDQQRPQVFQLRLAVQADDVDVDPVARLQLGAGEQVLHQRIVVEVFPRPRNDHDPARVFVVGFVTQVGNLRRLGRLGLHHRGDLLQHLGARDLMRQRGDDDVAVFDVIHGAHAHRTATGFVDFQQVGARGDDFRFGRVVRALDVFTELFDRGLGLIEQTHARRGDFPQVVRRHVGGHAHGDAGGAVEQDVRQAGRQHQRLVQRTVEVRAPIRRALAQFAEQHFGITRQPRFGVTHGGEGLGIIRRTPVALAVDQRIAIAERLGHQHHGFVAGRVAVGVEFTEHVTDGTRRFLVLGIGVQPQLAHGVDDTPLYRFQAVADMRQGTVHDHVHGVVEVGIFGEVSQ
ncbi:hypothetical protein D3C75_415590 [compost metagenome]